MEVNEAVSQIRELAHEEAHIIFGASIINDVEDEIKITVIATDFEDERKSESKPSLKTRPSGIIEKKEPPIKREIAYDELEIPPWVRKGKRD